MSRVDLIVSLSQQLEDAVAAADQGKTLETLVSISELDMPPSLLRSSSIARVVGKQRKHPNSDVAALAGDVVSRWKQILTENPVRTISSNADSTLTDHDLSVDLHTSLLSSVSAVHIPGQHTDPALRCDQSRMRVIRGAPAAPGNVVYWMSRDQRIADNWALIKAQELAVANKAGLAIVFCLSSSFLGANLRHFGFMLRGLKELESKAAALNIQLHVLCGPPQDVLPTFIVDNNVSTVVCDFSPLRIAKQWKADVVTATASLSPAVQVVEVDAHNIAPCFRVSEKCEFSAKTIRTKIHNAVNIYLTEFPPVIVHPFLFSQVETEAASQQRSTSMWTAVAESVLPLLDTSVAEIDWMIPGEAAAWSHMRGFIPRLKSYGEQRNDPSVDNGVSHLSPYFHFGHLSVQRVLLEIKRTYNCGTGALFPSGERTTGIHSFCEEAVVRKELSDNFCNYNSKYDSIDGAHK